MERARPEALAPTRRTEIPILIKSGHPHKDPSFGLRHSHRDPQKGSALRCLVAHLRSIFPTPDEWDYLNVGMVQFESPNIYVSAVSLTATGNRSKSSSRYLELAAQTGSVSSFPIGLWARVLQEPIPVAQGQRNNFVMFICRRDVHL
jgi:hypothetical protein